MGIVPLVCSIQLPWGLPRQSSEAELLPPVLSQRPGASVFPKELQRLNAAWRFPSRRALTVTRWLPVLSLLRLPWTVALSRSHPRLWSEPKLQVGPVAVTGVCPQDSVSEKAEPAALSKKAHPPLEDLWEVFQGSDRFASSCLSSLPTRGEGHVVLPASLAKWSSESSRPASGMRAAAREQGQ